MSTLSTISINFIKDKCNANNGNWKGFRIGDNGALLVRIRKTSPQRHFFIIVDGVENIANDYGSVMVSDPTGRENGGVATRYNDTNFNPPE